MSSTAQRGVDILRRVIGVMEARDADYKGSDAMYAAVMGALFPDGVTLASVRDQHRYHIFMLMMVKVTRYARNWKDGHEDSLLDLAAYSSMLAAIDAEAEEGQAQAGA